MTLEELEELLRAPEDEHLEFKAARNSFDSRKLRKYLAALANEGGGRLILGVADEQPRQVVGSSAFPNANADINNLRRDLRPSPAVRADEVEHPDGRVLAFTVGARPRGQVVRYARIAWARTGESLTDMPSSELRAVLLEDTDATAEACPETSLSDIDPDAFEVFREGVVLKTIDERQRKRYATMPREGLLRDMGLMNRDGTLLRAAILLFGTESALREWAPNAEVIFEYRRSPGSIRYERRVTLRRAVLLAVDDLWHAIQAYAYQSPIEVAEATRVIQRPRFPERSIREVLLNAVCHRDYHDPESVIVHMSPEGFICTSPGPFPATITPENVAREQYRRNRLLAEALEKCGQIERSGQGIDLMIEAAVRQAQPLPVFEEPDGRQVRVTLNGTVDRAALGAVQQIPDETWGQLSLTELEVLDAVRRGVSRQNVDAGAAHLLIERGLIEPSGPGNAPYRFSTALRRDVSENLMSAPARILQSLVEHPEGLTLSELRDIHGELAPEDLKRHLQWLRRNNKAYTEGRTRAARWRPKNTDERVS